MLPRVCLLVLLAVSPLLAADENPLAEAEALIAAGQAEAAYALLLPLEAAHAGEPAFDYLLGLAALDAGHPLEATFALERVLDARPEHGPARAELARAYLALGETDDAREEFDKVQAMDDLPPEARQTIDRYLSNIELFHDRTRTRFRPWIQVGLGYDTNVNGATDQAGPVAVPIAPGIPFFLGGEENSPVWAIGAGVRFTSPIDVERGLSLIGRIGLDHRLTVDEADFSTLYGDGQLGLHLRTGRHQFTVAGEGNIAKIDGSSLVRADRETAGVSTQWQFAPDDNDQFTSFAQFSIVRYPEQRVRDVNRVTGGLGWGHAFSTLRGTPIVYGSVFGGFEDAQSGRGSHFGRDFYGVRVGGSVQLAARHSVFGAFTWQDSNYDDPDPSFLVRRDDQFHDVTVGYRFQYDENWSLSPVFRFNDNDSNVVINDYDRYEFMLTVRNDF